MKLDVGQIVVSPQKHAVFRQHRCETFLRGFSAGSQVFQNVVRPAGFAVGQQRFVEVCARRVSHWRRRCKHGVGMTDQFDD